MAELRIDRLTLAVPGLTHVQGGRDEPRLAVEVGVAAPDHHVRGVDLRKPLVVE